mgnify:CR=1 FL=1
MQIIRSREESGTASYAIYPVRHDIICNYALSRNLKLGITEQIIGQFAASYEKCLYRHLNILAIQILEPPLTAL